MSTWVPGINVITLFVDDLDAARSFYASVFDLPVHFEDADSAVFHFGNMMVNLLKRSQADELVNPANVAQAASGAQFVLTIEVDDVDATCARLQQQGVSLLNGPMDRPWGIRTASYQDPAGYIWEIAK